MRVKPTSEKAAGYIWFGQRCLALGETGRKAIIDGPYTILCIYNPQEATLVALKTDGILAHPRSGDLFNVGYAEGLPPAQIVRGGWDSKIQPFDSTLIYPLIDDQKGSAVISSTAPLDLSFNTYAYGNFYAVDPSDNAVVVSWKGPPARHVPINQLHYSISGLDTTDESSSFTSWIYQGGEKYIQAPRCNDYSHAVTGYANAFGLILGCGFHNGNLLAMVAHTLSGIVSNGVLDPASQYGPHVSLWVYNGANEPANGKNSDNTKIDGWERLAIAKWNAYPYYTVPWSFNMSGTLAVSSNNDECIISKSGSTFTAEFIIRTAGNGINANITYGTRTIVGDSASDLTDYNSESHVNRLTTFSGQEEHKFFGFYADELLHAAIKVNDVQITSTVDRNYWSTVVDQTPVRTRAFPNELRIDGDLSTLYASLLLDSIGWSVSGCPTPRVEWTVTGPVSFKCLNDSCSVIELVYEGDDICVAPAIDGSTRTIEFSATAASLNLTATKTWSISSKSGGTWCHTDISQTGTGCAPGWRDAWWSFYVTGCGTNSCETAANLTYYGMNTRIFVCEAGYPNVCYTTFVQKYTCP